MWSYNGIRIYVVDSSNNLKETVARLQPLRYKTVHHVFGWESPITKLKFYVVGSTNMANLETVVESGTSMVLGSPWGDLGNYYPSTMTATLLPTIRQTLDITQDCTALVYMVEGEFYKDV